ncbi:hypothetical protein PPTG_09013 [Phytophthora nicotianae INRA-310]|uniref:Uncharacterized protein n=1 Tax=Phytophthora nicotianae (strain INRA-310) TaxID=761204 RepID=W2QIP7_PHYN3|nr:hypothetical protein PPTG_09013 [Phytophthora nicotianae INRA-310]ETN13038.1 hypothetical protein PPTG_09013 [Phytophthora nicotianae INRA-310]
MAAKGVKNRDKASDDASKSHLRTEDLYAIVTWLEHPPNFVKCFGTTGKPSVGKQSTKTSGFKEMANTLFTSSKGKFNLKPHQMRNRFTTYKVRYLQDAAKGIHTLKQKLDFMCPWYEKMNDLFGKKSNVTPLDSFDSTEVEEEGYLTEGDKDNEEDDGGEGSAGGEDEEGDEDLMSVADSEVGRRILPRPRSLSFSLSDTSDAVGESSPHDFPSTQVTPASATLTSQEVHQPFQVTVASDTVTTSKRLLNNDTRMSALPKSQPSKKARLAPPPATLNTSPQDARGSGSRIATAMKQAAESKAKVEKLRLEFDKEKWSSEAERQSDQQVLQRERLAFEKTKWEKEREDRRSELKQQQRFNVLNSLIEKGHSVEEAEAFLKLL